MFGEVKVSRDRLRCVFSFFTSPFFFSRLAVSPILQRVQVMQQMALAEVQVKCLVILNIKSLESRYFLYVTNKRTCSLVWNNALLTKKLPMFLSRNEINGGYEKILPVSGSFEVI